MPTGPIHFSAGPGPRISPKDAVAALIVLPGRRYLMQRRDDRADIIYPGHWSCFGGAVQPGEGPRNALARELREELEFEIEAVREYATFDFDLGAVGRGRFYRKYFVVHLPRSRFATLVLHEGSGMRVFSGEDLLRARWVVPHDAFAVWLHCAGRRVRYPSVRRS